MEAEPSHIESHDVLARPVVGSRFRIGLVVVIATGIILRAVLALRDGHVPDVEIFLAWLRGLHQHGLPEFYDHVGSNYPPLYMLVLWAEGAVIGLFDPVLADGVVLRACLRIPACLCDVALAIVLFSEGRRLWGAGVGLAAAALYLLNPVALYNSAYWGQVDSMHTLAVVVALVCLNRRRPGWAGVAMGLALMQKLQAVAFVPVVLFEACRVDGARGLRRGLLGFVAAVAAVMAPFIVHDCAVQALQRGYGVVGQYDRLSVNAFNLWQALGDAERPSSSTPRMLVALASGDELTVSEDAAWFLALSWRTLAIAACGLTMALALSLYSFRPGAAQLFVAAAVCALLFFCLLTEMHERYAFPAIALLALWAARERWCERLYVALSVVMLLNLEYVESTAQLLAELSWLMIAATVAVVAWLVVGHRGVPASPDVVDEQPDDDLPLRVPIVWFRRLTACLWVAAVLIGVYVAAVVIGRPTVVHEEAYLSALTPVSSDMGYGELRLDRTMNGAALHLGQRYYLKGLGTHAPGYVHYDIPPGFGRFVAEVGINRHASGRARVVIRLDGQPAFESGILRAEAPPERIEVELGDARRLQLDIDALGRNNGDHVDWALARFER